MRTIVVAVAILSACFMQEVSGDFALSSAPVNSATLKKDAKIELKEGTQVLDEDDENVDEKDNTEDEEQDETGDEEQDDAKDEEQQEGEFLALIATNEQDEKVNEEDEKQDDAGDEDQDEEQDEQQDDADVPQADEEDNDKDEIDPDVAQRVKKLVAGMSQSVKTLYARAGELETETEKNDASDVAHRASDQALEEFKKAFEKEEGSEAKLGEQDNEQSRLRGGRKHVRTSRKKENEGSRLRQNVRTKEAVRAIAPYHFGMKPAERKQAMKEVSKAVRKLGAGMSQSLAKLYLNALKLVKETRKKGASDEVNRAADQALKTFGEALDNEPLKAA